MKYIAAAFVALFASQAVAQTAPVKLTAEETARIERNLANPAAAIAANGSDMTSEEKATLARIAPLVVAAKADCAAKKGTAEWVKTPTGPQMMCTFAVNPLR